ncbi:MAG: hypothetical protein PUG90_03250 [Clostridia bacterium]|nr:hypothetical protein [Clostridia bacterium]MDY4083282.1 hypothetical protein [Eubacteriales bacterium]
MTNKINKKFIITITSIILIVSLVCALLVLIDRDTTNNEAVAEELISANSTSTDGTIDGVEGKHATLTELQNKAIAAGKTLKTISTQSELENFLANNVSTDYGALYNVSGDLTLDWVKGDNYASSNKYMRGAFDGNGYTINIKGGVGKGAFASGYAAKHIINTDPTLGGSDTATNPIYIAPSGFFVAINEGIIKNVTFSYTSTHIEPNGRDANGGTSLYNSFENGVTPAFGIIAGMSNGGEINNCKVILKNPFVLYGTGSGSLTSNGRFRENSAIAGGAVGIATNGATISNITVDLQSSFSVVCRGNTNTTNSARATLTCAGGIVGNFVPIGGTTIKYCTVLGNGTMSSIAGSGAHDYDFHTFAGGVIGGSFRFTGVASWENFVMSAYPEAEITAIMSNWQGRMRFNNQVNYQNMRTDYAKLFGAIGSRSGDLTGVSGMVFLYDYKTFCEAKGVNGTYIDSWWMKYSIDNIGTMIYPTSTGGQVDVSFDNSNPKYDIRIEAKADGFEGDMSQTLENTYYKKLEIADGAFGNCIWEANINKNGQQDKHIKAEQFIGGEIFLLKATDYGTMNYSFGEIADYSISSNNGLLSSKDYDADPINEPTLVLKSKLGNTLIPNASAYEWELLKGATPVTNAQTFLPGVYTYRAVKMLEEEKLAYYDANNKVLARYKESEKETFAVNTAELKFDAPNENVWLNQANIGMYIDKDKAWMFNYVKYSTDGTWSGLQPTFGVAKYVFKDNVSTGKAGRTYAFQAYVYTDGQEVLVAQSSTQVKVRIDNEKPLVEDVHYYLSDSMGTKGDEITVSDLNEWRTTPILMTYTVNDESRSGIVSGSGHTDYTTNPDGTWSCSVLLKDTKEYTLSYTDATNNTVSMTYNVKIDNVTPQFNVIVSAENVLQDDGETYYYFDPLKITYNSTLGESGYDLYVSTASDSSIVGADKRVWVHYDDTIASSGQIVVNDNLESQEIWFKLVNKQDLYPEKVIQLTSGTLTEFTIRLAIARIYINTENIFNKDGVALSTLDLSQALSKTFDNQTINKIEGATVKLYQEDGSTRYGKSGIVYCDGRSAATDKVVQEALEVYVQYENKHAGTTTAYLFVKGSENYGGKDYTKLYPVYFLRDGEEIEFTSEGYVVPESIPQNPDENVVSEVTINKYNMTVDVASYVNATYTFGDVIPATFDVALLDGSTMTFDVKGGLATYCDAKTYPAVDAQAQTTHADIDFTIQTASVVVNKKKVSAIPTMDGEKNFSAKRDYDNKEHVFAATFKDVYGDIQPVNVEFFQNYERTTRYTDEAGVSIKTIRNAGYYYVKFSTTDTNYEIVNSDEFELEIVKAFMELVLGTREMDYKGRAISYDFTVNADPSLYSMDDFKLTYYPYPSTAVYDPVNKKITSGKPLSTPIAAEDVINVGYYSVTIEFKENDNFYTQTYNDSLLVIVRAETEIIANDVTVVYTGDDFTFNHQDADSQLVGKNTGVVLANMTGLDEEGRTVAVLDDVLVTINRRNGTTGVYEPITPTTGWFSQEGSYDYKLIYAGDDNHMPCEKEVKLIIEKATFEGIVFEGVTQPYSGKNVSVVATVPDRYSGYELNYFNGAKKQPEPFEFVDANTYKVKVVVTMDNYNDWEKTVEVKIDRINITGVTAINVSVDYDGNPHRAGITGIKYNETTKKYTYNNLDAIVTATDVEAIDVGVKKGKYVIIVNNYNPLTIETTVNITPYEVPSKDVSYQSLSTVKFNTTTDLSRLTASFTDVNGEVQTNRLRFFKVENGEETEVGLKKDGTLPAGTYRAYVAADSNYTITNYVEFTIVSSTSQKVDDTTNSKQMMIIIGAAAGAVVLIGVIAGVAIAIKKKKNSAI